SAAWWTVAGSSAGKGHERVAEFERCFLFRERFPEGSDRRPTRGKFRETARVPIPFLRNACQWSRHPGRTDGRDFLAGPPKYRRPGPLHQWTRGPTRARARPEFG